MAEVITEATMFCAACYGVRGPSVANMSEVRYQVWTSKMRKRNITSAPKLHTLPPTSESFAENVKRAHLQAAVWLSADSGDPPVIDPTELGWTRDEPSRCLVPVSLPPNRPTAPDELLKMICCSCASDPLCSTLHCGCASNHLPCTIFCSCKVVECNSQFSSFAAEMDEDHQYAVTSVGEYDMAGNGNK